MFKTNETEAQVQKLNENKEHERKWELNRK